MSIRPGSSVTSPRSTVVAESGSGPSGLIALMRLTLDHHHCRRANLAGVDVGPPRRAQDRRTGHGTGSDTQSRVEAPESGTRGCFQHSTGNDTMIIEYSRCMRFWTSSGKSSSGNLSQYAMASSARGVIAS